MSEHDRKMWALQVAALQNEDTAEEGDSAFRVGRVAWLNEARARAGFPPLEENFENAPEVKFHELAVARGLRRPLR